MPIITIRGHHGSGAHDIAMEVARRLEAPYMDHGILKSVALELGVAVEEVETLEQVPSTRRERVLAALEKAFTAMGQSSTASLPFGAIGYAHWYFPVPKPVGEDDYLEALKRVVHELATLDSLVLIGRGTQVMLQNQERAFHVFVTAPLEVRAKRVMEQEGLDEGAAQARIAAMDGQRKAYVKKYFDADLEDLRLYDLVLDTAKVSQDGAVDTILRLAADVP